MKKLRIYVDTSVLGGCFEAEFAEWSNGLMDDFRSGHAVPVLSELLASEIRDAPPPVRNLHGELVALAPAIVTVGKEALDLLAVYEARAVLGQRYRADMLHVALATVGDAEILASWNFRHLVRFDKIQLFNAANVEQGYRPIAIHSPREVTTYGRDASG